MTYDAMPVRDADGGLRKVSTITCNEDSVGNMIAEGHMAEGDRYQRLYDLYRAESIRAHWKHADLLRAKLAHDYADAWVERWLEDTA